jgi:hypothetical protein
LRPPTYSETNMIDDEQARADFGCEHCWPANPDAAWEARRALAHEVDLVDESHFHVMILACGRCTQHFVSIFTETIDWADGEDPQYWTLLPITDAEATELVQRQGSVTETQLNALGPGRRCLRRDYPKSEAPRILWGAGISVGPHD